MGTIKKIIKTETGLAMPLVLMIMVILLLLGTALWQYSVSDLKQVALAENKTRAHYVARSAAETVARHIMKDPGLIDDLTGEVFSNTVPLEGDYLGDAGEMSVSIKRINGDIHGDIHEVTGTGVTNGIQQTATIVLRLSEFPVKDAVLVSTGDQSTEFHSGMTVEGNIVSGGDVSVPDSYDGSVIEYGSEEPENGGQYKAINNYPFPENYFDRVVVPENPDLYIDSMTIDSTYVIGAGEHIEISSLTVANGGTLKFITEPGITTILVVDNIDFKNGSTIAIDNQGNGFGVVRIYVREEMKAHAPQTDFPVDARLQFFLAEGCSVSLNGNVNIGGLMYGPYDTHVYLQSNAQIDGALIVGTISGQGGGNTIGASQTALRYVEGMDELNFPDIVNMLYWKP